MVERLQPPPVVSLALPSCGTPPRLVAPNLAPHVATLMVDKSPELDGLRAFVASVVPGASVKRLHLLQSLGPIVYYRITTAVDRDDLAISFSPRTTRLLRSECFAIRSESAVLQWLSQSAGDGCPTRPGNVAPSEAEAVSRSDAHATCPTPGCTRYRHPLQSLPKLVRHGTARYTGHGEYNITMPVPGEPIAHVSAPISRAERSNLGFQIGQLLGHVSSQTSPSGKFGTALAILSPDLEDARDSSLWERPSKPDVNCRHDKWSDAFLSLLESTLRDAEDFKVAIRYEAIRDHVGRFKTFLDAVTVPRLVAVEAGEDANTLVAVCDGGVLQTSRDHHVDGTDSPLPADQPPGCPAIWPMDSPSVELEQAQQEARHALRITGLREWSNCVFGDPLFASVLSRNATPGLWAGLKHELRNRHPGQQGTRQPDLLEDAEHAEVRRLLYECHHAVTAIVREYCRRHKDSDDREMPARKRLTQALRKLDSMDDAGRTRRPQPGSDAPPAKRLRHECHDGRDD